MKNPVTLSDFVSSQNDLGDFTLIATRFVDLDGKEIYLTFKDGWYTDDAVCCSDLFDAGLDVNVLADFAERYQTCAVSEDGDCAGKQGSGKTAADDYSRVLLDWRTRIPSGLEAII